MENPFVIIYGKDQEAVIDKLITEFKKELPEKMLSHRKEIEDDQHVKYTFDFADKFGIYMWGHFQGAYAYRTKESIRYKLIR